MEQEVKSRLGPPVWVESCMTNEEYREYCRKYPTVTCPSCNKVADFNKHTKWRYGMGSGLSKEEIDRIDREIDSLKAFVLSQQKQEV